MNFIIDIITDPLVILVSSLFGIQIIIWFFHGRYNELFKNAVLYNNNAQYEKSISFLNKLLKLKPNHLDAYVLRGRSFLSLEHYPEALDDFNKALEIKPDSLNAYMNRGVLYENSKHHDKALSDFDRAIHLKPDNFLAYYNKGVSFNSLGLYHDAIECYNKAIAHTHLSEYNDAIDDFSAAIALKPDDFSLYIHRGVLHVCLCSYHDAFLDFSKAIEVCPQIISSYLLRYILSKHTHTEENNVLKHYADSLTETEWPFPVMQVFLDKMTIDECLVSAKHTDLKKESEQKYEAYYYLGEYLLFNNKPEQAKHYFQHCLNTHIKSFIEYNLAKVRLKGLGKNVSSQSILNQPSP